MFNMLGTIPDKLNDISEAAESVKEVKEVVEKKMAAFEEEFKAVKKWALLFSVSVTGSLIVVIGLLIAILIKTL